MSEIELKPCPFCGGEARTLPGLRRVYCFTATCGAEMSAATVEGAIKLWNTRSQSERVSRLEEAGNQFSCGDPLKDALHYGSRCRDCADEDGVCLTSGMPCAGRKKATAYVIEALRYYGWLPELAFTELPKARWSCSDDESGTSLTLGRQRAHIHDALKKHIGALITKAQPPVSHD